LLRPYAHALASLQFFLASDPNNIGIVGFSAGAELAAPAAVLFDKFDQDNNKHGDPLAGISSRPDFVGLVYPRSTPFIECGPSTVL
jgi:endo-1,4-beta-xylanase